MTNVCTFCKTEQETLSHFLFYCRYSNMLWKNIEQYYLTILKEFHGLCLREVIIGITMSKCPLLNYLILIGKLYDRVFMGLQKGKGTSKHRRFQI